MEMETAVSVDVTGKVMMNHHPQVLSAREVLTKVELEFAFISEKLVNLSLLTMRFGTRANEEQEEEEEEADDDSAMKALEFDLLSSILNSEVEELESLLRYLRNETRNARIALSPFQHSREDNISGLERKLHQAEQSLMEIKKQSYNFQSLSSASRDNNDEFDLSGKIKMQTADQRKNVLRMLEKSLAKEMELEKKLTESRNNEYELRMKLCSSQQDVVYMEEVIEETYLKWLEAENAVEVFKEKSREMSGKLQILQFNLSGSFKREVELKEKVEAEECALHKLDSSNARLHDFLMAQTEALKDCLKDAEERLIQLNIENVLLSEKVSSLEEQLDVEITDLEEMKDKLDYTEEKLIVVSESNEELNEEVRFFKGRLREVEMCLKEAEERKSRMSKDIIVHNKIMKKLFLQLASERERLHKQITNLSRESKKMGKTNPEEEEAESKSDIGSIRRIDVGALGFKHILVAIFVLLTASMAYFVSQQNI